MSKRLADRVAIVTGGGAGIGGAVSTVFASEGAKVIIGDINREDSEATTQAITDRSGQAIFVHADISKEADAKKLTKEALRNFGRVDILVNNAATFVLKDIKASVEDWNRSLSVNIIGTSLVSKYAVEAMKHNDNGQGKGAIVNLSSISGFIAQPGFVTYSATKTAILQMTRNMALDLAPFNIRVNSVSPGTILTSASLKHIESLGITEEEFIAQEGKKHILNRVGYPDEVAYPILFLASDEASFITATNLMVDGGYTAQ
jgi:NAD(P)-dependent dehydrogenase (short-subunit alcohol dehydrogenase family)